MKKFLWLFVSFVIVCSVTLMLAPQVQAISSSGKCGDNLTYSYSNGVLTISGTGKMSDSIYPNYSPFDNDKNIKSVIINEGVTSICTRAFYGCENLTHISLPSTIEQIDGQAFLKTSYYNNQENWENGVLYIGNHLIEAQDNLSGNYSIKSGTITIAYMAFDNCANLTGIVLPESVKFIGSQAFDRCSALASVSMSKNIKRIDSWAFGYMGACSKLKTIKLPNTVIDIESTAFRKTGFAQNSGNWKNGMLYIGNHLVDGGDKNYCEVADGTIDIARAAFEDGSNIKIISIPKTVKHIGAYQTYNCHSLKKIYYEGSQSEWNSIVAEPNNDLYTHNIVFGQKHQHTLRIVKENEKVATCTKNGEYVNVSYCEECESEIKREFITISAKGHIFGNWEQIKLATCTENGKKTRTCKKCNHKETTTIYKISSVTLSSSTYTYNGKTKSPSVTVKDSKGNKLTKNEDYTVTYGSSSRSAIGRYSVKVTFKGEYSESKTLYFTIGPKNPSSVSATLYGHDDVKVSWEKVSGATGYVVYYKKSTATSWSSKTTTGTSVKLANLSDGVKYDIKVVAYKTVNGNKCCNAGKSTCVYTLKKVTSVKVAKSSSKVKVSWANISGETGYQISKSTSESGTNIVATYKTTSGKSKTISATKGKTYYYKVRAYKVVDGKNIYGPWSSVVKYKMK